MLHLLMSAGAAKAERLLGLLALELLLLSLGGRLVLIDSDLPICEIKTVSVLALNQHSARPKTYTRWHAWGQRGKS